VPYRETIRGKADVQGRHKKQTGGHGQFGDCKIKMEPLPRGGELRVRQRNLRRLHSQNYIPAVEKGIKDAAQPAASWPASPWSNFSVILYDGSYHDVDSNDSFVQDRRPHRLPQSHGSRPSRRCWSRS
jgi:elongation factor G